jgi:hypothetical protein
MVIFTDMLMFYSLFLSSQSQCQWGTIIISEQFEVATSIQLETLHPNAISNKRTKLFPTSEPKLNCYDALYGIQIFPKHNNTALETKC